MRRQGRPTLASLILTITVTALVLTALVPAEASVFSKAVLTVFPDGWVDVLLEVNLSAECREISFMIDGEPHHLIVIGDGLLANYTLEGNRLTIETQGLRHVSVSYQTPSLTTKIGPVWNLTFDLDVNLSEVRLIDECAVLGMSDIPERIVLAGGWLSIDFKGGSHWISYKLIQKASPRIPPPKTVTESASETTRVVGRPSTHSPSRTTSENQVTEESRDTTPPSVESSTQVESRAHYEVGPILYLVPLGIAVLVIILLTFRGRKEKKVATEVTDELEYRILEFLRERGGRAMQSEIIRSMDAPRATVWRRLRRMEREGKVKLTKEGRFTVVELS